MGTLPIVSPRELQLSSLEIIWGLHLVYSFILLKREDKDSLILLEIN